MRFIILILAFVLPSNLNPSQENIKFTEQLIVFVQKSNSEVDHVFRSEMLPQIEALAKEENVEYVLQEIDGKAPKEVTYTPFITFRDKRGTSVFSGRWNQITKIRNFIRSTRVLHQEEAKNVKERILTWPNGRLNILAPLKITDLQGALPKRFKSEAFLEAAMEGVETGSPRFDMRERMNADLATRSFYWAMYPYRDKKGKIHITGEIYSQYNCVDPIYTHFEEPVVDKDVRKAFGKMAAILEEQTVYQLDNPKNGDGLQAVDATIKSIPWNQFGVVDGSDEEQEEINWGDFESKRSWKVKGAFADNIPMVYFKFIQPLDGYTGEVRELDGVLNLNNEQNLNGASGRFSIPVTAITMGDKGLDDAIHTFILDGENHPESTFEFKEMNVVSGSIQPGQSCTFEAEGIMNLKGKDVLVKTTGKIRPMLQNGTSYLHVNLKFGVDKSLFGVEKGPDGPNEIKEKMEFYMNFLLV